MYYSWHKVVIKLYSSFRNAGPSSEVAYAAVALLFADLLIHSKFRMLDVSLLRAEFSTVQYCQYDRMSFLIANVQYSSTP